MPFLSLLLSKRERLPHLKTYSLLAQDVLQKDKSGALLKQALAGVASIKEVLRGLNADARFLEVRDIGID